MPRVHNESARTSYPVYDGHGNIIAALSFSRPALGSGGTYPVPSSYGVSIGGERLYDAWGGVRAGQSHGYPNHRYCANLGHVADDETGLTYMRARYYEPSTGRFLSEDPAMDGRNWYVYCWNDPIQKVDFNGKTAVALLHLLVGAIRVWLGNQAAKTIWAQMIHADVVQGNHGSDVMDRMFNTYNSAIGDLLAGGLSAIVTYGLAAAEMLPAAASTAGSYGLAFAIGFAMGFMTTFYSLLLIAALDSAGTTYGETP